VLPGKQVVANGSCHSIEGIKLEELGLKAGDAKLLVRGSLLGAAQDASIILTDFPVAILQPLFRALPALEHAAPAVAASGVCPCPRRIFLILLLSPSADVLGFSASNNALKDMQGSRLRGCLNSCVALLTQFA
jgi:hypothetical protein